MTGAAATGRRIERSRAAGLDVHRFRAFGGASCEVLAVSGELESVSRAVADVYAFEARLTRFNPTSELSRFNEAAGRRTEVSPLLEALLRAALDAEALSGGLVNAAVHRALVVAGYDESIERVRARDALGAPAPVSREAAPVPSLHDVLEVGSGWARLRVGTAVDLGGVGKGWLADRLAERLGDACVNLGGDLRAVGGGPDGSGWSVGLCDGGTVVLRHAGAATSGISGRRWRGGHHLVDPRTGIPARTDVAAVSVVAADALTAEVLAKAAAILGCAAGTAWALRQGALVARALPIAPAGADAADPGDNPRGEVA